MQLVRLCSKLSSIITVLVLISQLQNTAMGKSHVLPIKPYRFDAGGSSSKISDGSILLSNRTLYKQEDGYGWSEQPSGAFTRADLALSRTNLTIDGVAGTRLLFRANLPAGAWWLTLWMEAGFEDSSTTILTINDTKIDHLWHPFRPSAEPHTQIQEIYRVYHGRVDIDDHGLLIRMSGQDDSVRVLGFTIIPDSGPLSSDQIEVLEQLRRAGRYGSLVDLSGLRSQLDRMVQLNPNDFFLHYWQQQLDLLIRAERYMNLMGWEWASDETGLGIFSRYHQAVMIFDALLNRSDLEDYPLYERVLWDRGKLLYWLGLERHGRHEIEGAQRDLNCLLTRHPNSELLRMYLGEKIFVPSGCDSLSLPANAPTWSVLQREALCRMREIAHWWVTERQAQNGELGGKIDDDVELLRWWAPLILAGDKVCFDGWKHLADCAWQSPKVYRGYSYSPRDVEHSSEFIADTAPQMIVYSDDPQYLERLRFSADYFKNLWTATTNFGHRFFRSTWFSSTEVKSDPPRNRDHEYNTRAVKSVRYLAWKTEDQDVIVPLTEWSQAWVNIATRGDKNKPRGIIPPSVRFPDEAINGEEPTWYRVNMFWDYYDWRHHVGSLMLDQLLFTFTMTKDSTLLSPLIAALNLVADYENARSSPNDTLVPGSCAWAAIKIRNNRTFWSVASQWRILTNDSRYDNLLIKYGTLYVRFRITSDEKYLAQAMKKILDHVRNNFPLLTSEVLHTDRVYVPGYENLKAMLTGDGVVESMSPYYAVSWENTDDSFTALVTSNGRDHLAVKLYSHSSTPKNVTMRLWQLAAGSYRLGFKYENGNEYDSLIVIKNKGHRHQVLLPSKQLLTLTLFRMSK